MNFYDIEIWFLNETALISAAKEGHLEIVRELLSQECIDVNITSIIASKYFMKFLSILLIALKNAIIFGVRIENFMKQLWYMLQRMDINLLS